MALRQLRSQLAAHAHLAVRINMARNSNRDQRCHKNLRVCLTNLNLGRRAAGSDDDDDDDDGGVAVAVVLAVVLGWWW